MISCDHSEYLRFPWEENKSDWNVPLYKSKLMGSFDHRFGTFADVSRTKCIAGQPRELSVSEKGDPSLSISPRYFLSLNLYRELFAKYPNYRLSWLLVWRDVTRSTDEHTFFATAIPKVLATRTCPALVYRFEC